MSDEAVAGLTEGTETPAPAAPAAPAPVQPSADIEAVKQEFEERIKGFQRLLGDRDRVQKELQAQLAELRTQTMSEVEREEFERKQEEAEIDQLRRENELLKLSREYPDEVPLFEQLLAAESPKEQLDLIRQLRAAQKAAAEAPAPEPEPEVPDVDPNNPRRISDFGTGETYNGVPITDDWAARVLGSAERMPGY